MKQKKPQFSYSVIEKKDNELDSIIKKEGWWTGEVSFSLNDIKKDFDKLVQRKKELTAQQDLENAKVQNVRNHYPEVEKLDKKVRVATFIYEDASTKAEYYGKTITELNYQMDEIAKELAEIEKSVGLKLNI